MSEKPAEPGVDVTRAMFGRKWLIILLVGLGLGLGHLQYTRQTPTYASSARIMVQRPISRLPVDSIETQARDSDPIDNHVYLLTQPTLLDRAVKDHDLGSLNSMAGTKNPVGVVASGLRVSRSQISKDVIELSYSGPDRNDCKRILDAVVDAYLKWVDDSQKQATQEAVRVISEAQRNLEDDMKEYQGRVRAFQATSNLMFLSNKGISIPEETLAGIAAKRTEAEMQRNEIQSSIDSIQSAIARGASREAILLTINMSIVNEAPGSNVEEKLDPYLAKVTELLIEKAEMLQKVGEGHPSIKAIDGRIELLRQFYRREAGDTSEARDLIDIHLESLHERIKGLDVKIANLNDRFESEQEKAKALATEQLEDQALKAEGEHLRGFLDVVLEKVREIDLVKDQGTLLATVTQRASNGMQIGPDFAKFLGLGGAVGFLAALGLSFLMEMADKGFRNPDEITRHLSLPVLGHVPELDAGRDWKVVKDGVVDRSVATHHRPKSRLAESYRAVRAALFFGMRGQNNRVLQVTSADPGDGKSTLAANVAAAIATSGKKCLLMDGDLRRPRVHAIFGIHNEKGVSSVVRDGMDVPDCIQTSAIENLDIMTVGPRVDNPAELLLSPRFTELVAMVRERYDFVLIDTPPVLAVTDPAAVAAHVDGVILVVRITKRSRPHAKRACETLDLIGARVLGVVVNGVGEGSGKYGAGYGYGYSYGGYGYNYGPGGYGEKGKNYSDSYFAEKATRG